MTKKDEAFRLVHTKGWCKTLGDYYVSCENCPIHPCTLKSKVTNSPSGRYERAVEWLITNGFKEDLMEYLI